MRRTRLVYILAAVVLAAGGCSGNGQGDRDSKAMTDGRDDSRDNTGDESKGQTGVQPKGQPGGHSKEQPGELPREQFDPEEAFSEIPHSSFEAVWLEGNTTDKDESSPVYEEAYDFTLVMDKAVIPYTISGKLIQTCKYSPSKERWNVERRTEDVVQDMDLSLYQWKPEDSLFTDPQTFVKTGPNTFSSGKTANPAEPYFTVDLLSGGSDLKDENGNTCLPGGQWTARMYIKFDTYPEFAGEAAIDLIGGSYGFNDMRWIIPVSELKRVDRERNMTDEERTREIFETFHQSFTSAASFELMDPALAEECSQMLRSCDFGNVGINRAAVAKDISGDEMGWVVEAYSEDSYNGDVVISVGIRNDGSIDGLEFLLLNDTAGLGLKAQDETFRNQFIGKRAESLTVTVSGNAGDSEINAVSSATITSDAAVNAVNAALCYVHNFTAYSR